MPWRRWLPLAIGFGGLLGSRPAFVGLRPRGRAPAVAAVAGRALPETYVEATEATDGSEGLYFQRHSRLAQHLFAEDGLRGFASWRDWYQAPWWLSQGDVMTVLAGTLREVAPVACETHFVETSDGGILALDAFSLPVTGAAADDAPVAVLIPGLGGSANGGYVRNMAFSLLHRGFHVLGLNMRGVGAATLRTPRFASAHRGSTGDLREAVSYIRKTLLPGRSRKVFAMGWSLGGNIVVNALAEQGPDHCPMAHLDGGVALCATHCLTRTARQYDEHWPMRHLYDPHVLRNLKKMLEPAMPFYRSGPVPSWAAGASGAVAVDHQRLASARRIRDIDEALIRRMFGYSSVEEYYHQASCSRRLSDVTVPLLLVSAADDPMTTSWVPLETVRSNEQVILAYTKHGGHIAWHDEKNVRKSHWVEDGVGSFLERLLTWQGEG